MRKTNGTRRKNRAGHGGRTGREMRKTRRRVRKTREKMRKNSGLEVRRNGGRIRKDRKKMRQRDRENGGKSEEQGYMKKKKGK